MFVVLAVYFSEISIVILEDSPGYGYFGREILPSWIDFLHRRMLFGGSLNSKLAFNLYHWVHILGIIIIC